MVTSVGFSRTGWLLGSSSWDGSFRLWDIATSRVVLSADGWSYQVQFSADDRRIARIQRSEYTGLLEITPSPILRTLHCHGSRYRGSFSADASMDGRLVAAACRDGVHLWVDERTEEPFTLPAGPCYSAIFTPDGTNLITCGPTGLALWPLRRIPGASTDELHIGPRRPIQDGLVFNYAALSTDGRWIAAANPNASSVAIYEVRHPDNRFFLQSQPGAQYPAMSPDGRWVAVGNWKGSGVEVWEFESRRMACELETPFSAWSNSVRTINGSQRPERPMISGKQGPGGTSTASKGHVLKARWPWHSARTRECWR